MSDLRIAISLNLFGNPERPTPPVPADTHLTPMILHVRPGIRGVAAYRLDGAENTAAIQRFSAALAEPLERHVVGGDVFFLGRNEWRRFESQVGTRMHLSRSGLERTIAGGDSRHHVTVCQSFPCHPLFRQR